jgi:hypothetical protein
MVTLDARFNLRLVKAMSPKDHSFGAYFTVIFFLLEPYA